MKKFLKWVGIILGITGIIPLIAAYNSYVYKTDFLLSLYGVFSNILSGIWQLVSNPVIFISLAIIFFIVVYKKYIPEILHRIELFKGLGIEVHLKEAQNQIVKVVNQEKKENIVAPNLMVAEKVVNTIGSSFCQLLIQADNDKRLIFDVADILGYSHGFSTDYIERLGIVSSERDYLNNIYRTSLNNGYLVSG